MMQPIKLGCDLDGPVINSYPIFREFFFKKYNFDMGPLENCIHEKFDFGYTIPYILSDEQCYRDVMEAFRTYDKEVFPVKGSLEALQEFSQLTFGEPIHFITARDPEFLRETLSWLQKHCNFEFELHLSYNKEEVIEQEDIDWFIDDRFKYAETLPRYLDHFFLFKASWNTGRLLSALNLTRINGIQEVTNLLKDKYCNNQKIA